MKTINSKNTKTMQYFTAAFKRWFEESNLNLVEAGAEFDLSHTFISQILNRKASLSIGTAELIADRIGKDMIEMLIEGRELLGEKPKNQKGKVLSKDEEALEAFKYALLVGGEAAEMLAKHAIDLANKKRAEATSPTETHKHLKSA